MGKLELMRVIDIAEELNISYRHARRIRKEIRSLFGITYVTRSHLERYLGVY